MPFSMCINASFFLVLPCFRMFILLAKDIDNFEIADRTKGGIVCEHPDFLISVFCFLLHVMRRDLLNMKSVSQQVLNITKCVSISFLKRFEPNITYASSGKQC